MIYSSPEKLRGGKKEGSFASEVVERATQVEIDPLIFSVLVLHKVGKKASSLQIWAVLYNGLVIPAHFSHFQYNL